MEIKITKTETPKAKPQGKLGIVPALTLCVVHNEHMVGKDMTEAKLFTLCGLGLGSGGSFDFDIQHFEIPFFIENQPS